MTKTIMSVLLLGGVALSASGSITVHDHSGQTKTYGDDVTKIVFDKSGMFDVTGSDPSREETKQIVVNRSCTLNLKNINLKNTRDGVSSIEVNNNAMLVLRVDGKNIISSGHGAAGILVTENAKLEIDCADNAVPADAVLYVSCGLNGAAIGGAGPYGTVERSVNGGTIAVGSSNYKRGFKLVVQRSDPDANYWCDGLGAAIGASAKSVEINNGTLDIQTPGGICAEEVVFKGGSVRVSRSPDGIRRLVNGRREVLPPVNKDGEPLELAKLSLDAGVIGDKSFKVEIRNENYGNANIFPLDDPLAHGKSLYLYLTKSSHHVTVSGDNGVADYMIGWNGSDFTLDSVQTESDSFCAVTLPNVEHLTTVVTTNGNMVTAVECLDAKCWMMEKGTAVQVAFVADHGYRVVGDDLYTVDSLSNDVIFGTTEGFPLPKVRGPIFAPVQFQKGTGVDKVIFACDGGTDFTEFPTGGTNLMVDTEIDIQVTVDSIHHNYSGPTHFTVEEGGTNVALVVVEISWGDKKRPWIAGDDVTVYTNGTTLIIEGSGAMSNYVDAASVPWAAVAGEVTEVAIAESVTPVGANSLAGLNYTAMVNGTPISSIRPYAQGCTGTPIIPVPPEGAVTSWDALTNAVATAESGAEIAVGADITETGGELVVPAGKAVTIKLYGKTVSCGRVTVGGALTVGDAEDSVGRIVASNGAKVAKGGSVTLLGGPMRGTFTTLSPGLILLFN